MSSKLTRIFDELYVLCGLCRCRLLFMRNCVQINCRCCMDDNFVLCVWFDSVVRGFVWNTLCMILVIENERWEQYKSLLYIIITYTESICLFIRFVQTYLIFDKFDPILPARPTSMYLIVEISTFICEFLSPCLFFSTNYPFLLLLLAKSVSVYGVCFCCQLWLQILYADEIERDLI